MEDYAVKWDRAKAMVKKKGRIDDWDHKLWIEPLQIERAEGNTLIVYCKSGPHLNYLKNYYLDLINDTLKKVGLNGYEVRLMLPAEDVPYVFFKDNGKKEKEPYPSRYGSDFFVTRRRLFRSPYRPLYISS